MARSDEMFWIASVNLPDGSVFNLKGLMEARCHDITLFRMSSIEEDSLNAMVISGRQYSFYGDKVYCLRAYLIVPFEGNY